MYFLSSCNSSPVCTRKRHGGLTPRTQSMADGLLMSDRGRQTRHHTRPMFRSDHEARGGSMLPDKGIKGVPDSDLPWTSHPMIPIPHPMKPWRRLARSPMFSGCPDHGTSFVHHLIYRLWCKSNAEAEDWKDRNFSSCTNKQVRNIYSGASDKLDTKKYIIINAYIMLSEREKY